MTDWKLIIPLIFAGLVQLLNAAISIRNGKKADQIHVLVNSGHDKALTDLAEAHEENRRLRALVIALDARLTEAAAADARVAQATLTPKEIPHA